MKLSRTSGYAIHVLLQLAETNSDMPVSCCQLASVGGMPERYLLEVLRDLVAHDLLHSSRGSDGGFALARPPEEITLCDVFEVFDTPRPAFMPFITGQSPEVRTKVMRALDLGFNAARAELQRLTVADLLGSGDSNIGPYNGSNGSPYQKATQ
jgi:Rrf2 family protein